MSDTEEKVRKVRKGKVESKTFCMEEKVRRVRGENLSLRRKKKVKVKVGKGVRRKLIKKSWQ